MEILSVLRSLWKPLLSTMYVCFMPREGGTAGEGAETGKKSLPEVCSVGPQTPDAQHSATGAPEAVEAMCLWGNLVICCSIFLHNLKRVLVYADKLSA